MPRGYAIQSTFSLTYINLPLIFPSLSVGVTPIQPRHLTLKAVLIQWMSGGTFPV